MAPNNPLTCHGNEKTMNLNHLILTNIQSSPYFKVNLYELKTYHEVIDEIYYKVDHLEPWEKGSRKTAGQTGMCGGVRGVGAGGIVSSSYCLLYKLFTLKLTRKQVIGLCTHTDSPYIRALGFMYIRYTQPPADMWDWYRDYLEDDEEIDVKAGGGHNMTIGEMLRQWMTKLEWYGTLFPRIPVPIQKILENNLRGYDAQRGIQAKPAQEPAEPVEEIPQEAGWGEAERVSKLRESPSGRASKERGAGSSRPSPPFDISKEIEREKERQKHQRSGSRDRQQRRSPHRHKKHKRSRSRERRRSKSRERRHSKSRERKRSKSRDRKRSRSRDRKRSRSRDRDRKHKSTYFEGDRKRGTRSRSRERPKHRHRSRSRERVPHKENSFERDLRKEQARIGREVNGD